MGGLLIVDFDRGSDIAVGRSRAIASSGSPYLPRCAFAAIGFADDYIKVVHRRNLGLTAAAKTGPAESATSVI